MLLEDSWGTRLCESQCGDAVVKCTEPNGTGGKGAFVNVKVREGKLTASHKRELHKRETLSETTYASKHKSCLN